VTTDSGQEHDSPSGGGDSTIDLLAASFAAHLGQQVTIVDSSGMTPDGFACFIRSPAPAGPTLQVAWEGVLGMKYIDGRPDISVSLFLFSRGRRLRLDDHHPGSYLEIVYEGPLDGSGTWRDLGWLHDGFGEFEAYDRYGE